MKVKHKSIARTKLRRLTVQPDDMRPFGAHVSFTILADDEGREEEREEEEEERNRVRHGRLGLRTVTWRG